MFSTTTNCQELRTGGNDTWALLTGTSSSEAALGSAHGSEDAGNEPGDAVF